MCGIAGVMVRTGAAAPDAAVLDRLTRALAHRGPDGDGRYVHDAVAMVQTRLAIIDLETGDQPLFAGEGPGDGPALVANGEIYNHVELRRHLGPDRFKTGSDCETALALFADHGERFAERLRGMYAIALHDPAAGRLYLARDPFGIKPLYVAETDTGLAFASEPQALIAAGLADGRVRDGALAEVLQTQFLSGPGSVFAGIERVAPGETLVCEDGRIVARLRRRALPDGGPRAETGPEAVAWLDALMRETVDLHQRSDVPYGMFLSGGVDSAAVLAMMARLNVRPVQAFTAGFDAPDAADERARAERVAAAAGAEHTCITVGADDFWRDLPAIARALDEPVCDYAVVPTWALARAARAADLKVVLTGEGGDELFAGYGRYRRARRWRLFGGRAMRETGALDGLGLLKREDRAWRRGFEADDRAAAEPGRTRLQQAQAVDIAGWLPYDLLTKLDRCLMAHGVEGRVPFVDAAVADFAFRLPDRLKVRGRAGKWALRAWLEAALPEADPWARKQGFTVPVGAWIGEQGERLGPLVARDAAVSDLCRADAVRRVFAEAGRDRRAGHAAWSLLFLALWRKAHVDGAPAGGGVFETLGA
jgi:asparagine synthase (glutamine-hydrolysing)